jgi:hypothetical protein
MRVNHPPPLWTTLCVTPAAMAQSRIQAGAVTDCSNFQQEKSFVYQALAFR